MPTLHEFDFNNVSESIKINQWGHVYDLHQFICEIVGIVVVSSNTKVIK